MDALDNRSEHPGERAASAFPVVDPDVDLHDPAQRAETRPHRWDLVAATSLGGILGSLARYGVDVLVPHPTTAFPWSTIVINASGSLLIGVLMVIILELSTPHRLVRPFLGAGVLGGYTTYSTFAVDAERLVMAHRPGIALVYIVVTLVTALGAVAAGVALTRALGTRARSGRSEA